jgi:hypothetical protein
MFQKLLLTLTLSFSCTAFADLSDQGVRERLQINADIYIVDSSGKKIISGPERTNYWRLSLDKGTLKGGWSSRFSAGLIAFEQSWEVDNNGSIKVSIGEYAQEENGKMTKLLEKKEFIIENFEPITWKVKNIKSQNFIVRFIPTLREISSPISVDNLPIAGTQISISDNNGYLWADDVQLNGKYSGFTSHRGSLALSYVPFKGAREMGIAEGNHITLNVDKKFQINLKAATSFLPAGVVARVYAIYKPDVKSKGFNSLHSFDTNKEDKIQEIFKK